MMARSFSSSATGHHMILRASASDMPITSWRQALHEGEKKTRAVVSSSISGPEAPHGPNFAPGEPPKGQEEEGTPEDKQGGSVAQGRLRWVSASVAARNVM